LRPCQRCFTYRKTSSLPFPQLMARRSVFDAATVLLFYIPPVVQAIAALYLAQSILRRRFHRREAILSFLLVWSALFYLQVVTRSDLTHLLPGDQNPPHPPFLNTSRQSIFAPTMVVISGFTFAGRATRPLQHRLLCRGCAPKCQTGICSSASAASTATISAGRYFTLKIHTAPAIKISNDTNTKAIRMSLWPPM
jgi:hypothetical protein